MASTQASREPGFRRFRPDSIRRKDIRYGITGHRDLTTRTVEMVIVSFSELLSKESARPIAVTCLAEGADQLFARAVLDHGGMLDVIVPSVDYREHMTAPDAHEYDRLLDRAVRITRLPYAKSDQTTQMAASLVVVERSSLLVAVWDGQPARGFGGTADVVGYARQVQVPVEVVWPAGSSRGG